MTASQIDLSGKFSDEILVDELISHLELQDIARDDAIATFLDDETGSDNEAYQFVRDFCSKIDQILSPADNSLASVKTLRIVEESNKDIRALANQLSYYQEDSTAQLSLLESMVDFVESGEIQFEHLERLLK